MDNNNSIVYILLSSAVFAALITSITNLIISLINNRRLKKLEKKKSKSEINQYRYSRLYEVLLNLEKYESELTSEPEKKINNYQIYNRISDNIRKYLVFRSLLDEQFTTILDSEKEIGEDLLSALSHAEIYERGGTLKNSHPPDIFNLKCKCFDWTVNFSELLIATINDQLKILLDINNHP